MKRIIAIIISLSLIAVMPVGSQMIVSNPALEATQIASLLQTVMQVENTISSIQNQIKQLEQMYKEAENYVEMMKNLESPESLEDLIGMVDQSVTFYRNMENQIKSQTVTIGHTEVPLTEMYRVDNVVETFLNDTKETLEADYTDAEAAYIYSHLGISPANYMWIQEKSRKVAEIGATTAMITDRNLENFEAQAEALSDLQDQASSSTSAQEVGQATFEVNRMIAQGISDLNILMGQMAEAVNMINTEIHNDAMANKIEGGASEAFMNSILAGE